MDRALFLKEKRDERLQAFKEVAAAQIPVIGWLLPLLSHRFFWYYHDNFVSCFIRAAVYEQGERTKEQLKRIFAEAVNCYHLLAVVLVAICYALLFLTHKSDWRWGISEPVVGRMIIGAVVLYLAYRFVEIAAVIVQLHLTRDYKPFNRPRAIAHLVINYFEIGLLFACLFIIEHGQGSKFCGDKTDLTSDFITPYYFSVVTLATIGYGDIAPTDWIGRSTVVCEVMTGFVFVAIVAQQVLSSKNTQESSSQD